MSYIPKYILKRMIPKDAIKIDGDDLKIEMTNVISPISIDEVPEDVLNYLEVKIDENIILNGEKTELASGLKILWEEKVFTIENIKNAVGETLPVGGKLSIIFPNKIGLKVGDKHVFEVTIKTDNPINIKFERTIV